MDDNSHDNSHDNTTPQSLLQGITEFLSQEPEYHQLPVKSDPSTAPSIASNLPPAHPSPSSPSHSGIVAGVTSALSIINKFHKKHCPSNSSLLDQDDFEASAKADNFRSERASGKSTKRPPIQTSMLVIQCSPDFVTQYNSLMNCAFAALSLSCPVSTLYLPPTKASAQKGSVMLKQLTSITGGTTLKPPFPAAQRGGGLTQILLSVYLPPPSASTVLTKPQVEEIRYLGRCFDSGEEIGIGWVCNLCLSVWGKKPEVCRTCGADVENGDLINP
ncbi:hypothetical protein TrCOL_g5795 [Triparma columacea]|uniref:Uncharacterized protein n=1 Tax=Triparma columacea TaxID=722753 RepID=A0A9W7GB96_9STRA|nr:hypothetical protein TrCOL_g5795 [Triparma columacea]